MTSAPAPAAGSLLDLAAAKEATIRRIKGPTIILGSGSYFDFEAPETSLLTIEDVAYGLAHACRFAGQCVSRATQRRTFYSVAQHCVLMSRAVPTALAYDALMHELGEATCGDMTSPLKSICPDYKAVEKRCEAAGLARFGVSMSDPDAVKHWDLRMLATERRDLLPWQGEEWDSAGGADPLAITIEPWAPEVAAVEFLIRYHELAPRQAAPEYYVVDLRARNLAEPYLIFWRAGERGYSFVLGDAGRFSAEEVGRHFGRIETSWQHFPVQTEIAALLAVPDPEFGVGGAVTGAAVPNTTANRRRLVEAARAAAARAA